MSSQWTTVNPEDVDKASATWSGFLYQGKVAIYTVLKYINYLYKEGNDISNYMLEIEYLEDFAILKDEKHISLHQVKAKPKTNTIGSYNEAILNLLGKMGSYKTVSEVSLHTAVDIKTFTKEKLFKNLLDFDVKGKKAQLQIYKKIACEESNFNKMYEKLKISCNTGLVPIERSAPLIEIKDLILSEIKTFYDHCTNQKLKDLYSSTENKERIYSNLINMIEEKVHNDHLKKLKEGKILIGFCEFREILDSESIFSFSNKTISNMLLHLISEDFVEYCKYYGVEDEDLYSREIWRKYLVHLKNLKPNDFLLLCRKLTPQLQIKNRNKIDIEEFRKIMEPTGVRNSFLHGLIKLNEKIDITTEVRSSYIINNKGVNYVLSTIDDSSPVAHTIIGEEIFKNLSQDDEMFEMLFDIGAYINSLIDNEFDGSIIRVHTDVESEVVMEEELKETITTTKKIRFVRIDTLSKELLG
ncbi:TPA: hypothetical protein QCQ87_001316 [Bacillus paranthracis]|uniref:ABC-three component system protein n=1 Tax=Bacillus cereus group sp. MYBK101-2 TaxID=3450700 RepID=UPI0032FD3F1D|nr:hypothetical protein [Bacillus paranthracis]